METPGEWIWPSYGHYCQGRLDGLVDEHGLYNDLGRMAQARQIPYRDYVMQE